MARFSATYDETFTVPVSPEAALAHFTDIDTIGAHYGPVEEWKKVDDSTLYIRLKPQEHKGVRFLGQYTARYTRTGGDAMRWDTLGGGNMRSTGHATFKARAGGAEVSYHQTIEVEMEVGRLLAVAIGPFVTMGVKAGVRDYLERMRGALARS